MCSDYHYPKSLPSGKGLTIASLKFLSGDGLFGQSCKYNKLYSISNVKVSPGAMA